MRRFLLQAIVLVLSSLSSASASPLYRIDFSGVTSGGTLSGSHQTQFSTFELPFVPGSRFAASILADFDLAAPPLIDSTGVHWIVPSIIRVTLELPTLPDDVLLPIPNTFVIGEGFTNNLRLQFATGAQVVFPQITFDEPGPLGRNFKKQGVMSAFLGPAPGIVIPVGALHPSFAATGLQGAGQFNILKIDQGPIRQPPLFGLDEFYDISLRFTVNEARGSFVPEPGTAALLGLAVPVLLIASRLRRIRG